MLNTRHIAIGGALIFGLLILIAVISSYATSFVDVKVLVAPQNAKITLDNGKVLKNNHLNRLRGGTYKATLTSQGYANKTINLTVSKNGESSLSAVLNPENETSEQTIFNEANQRIVTEIESLPGGVFDREIASSDDIKIRTCQSLRYTDNRAIKALCISGSADSDFQSALLQIPERKHVEILYGSPSLYNVFSDQNITVQYISTVKTDKPTLYVKVLDDQLLGRSNQDITQSIRDSLAVRGYDPDKYYLSFANNKLDEESNLPDDFDDKDNHLHAPYEVPGVPRE